VAGAYEALAHFDLFAAQAMLYFAMVSFAEVSQRIGAGMTRVRPLQERGPATKLAGCPTPDLR
jgi:hypothetical protein